MNLLSWICLFSMLAVLLIAAAAFVFLILLAGPRDECTVHEELPCPRCERTMRYRAKRNVRIRCSCGNVMPAPEGVKSVKCPGCLETVHAKFRRPTRVRCKCGNVSEIPRA